MDICIISLNLVLIYMNYTKRRIKKYTHRKININRKTNNRKTTTIIKTNNRKIIRKTRRNFKGRRVMTGGNCAYSSMPAASNYNDKKFNDGDKKYVRFMKKTPETPETTETIKKEVRDFLLDGKTNFFRNKGLDVSFDDVQTEGLKLGPYLENGLADPSILRTTFYFNLLKYVVCNYISVITEFRPEYIRALFIRLEEMAITGMFPLYIEDKEIIKAYKFLGVDECTISNTIIIICLNVTGVKEKNYTGHSPPKSMCPYGSECYRTGNLIHMNEFDHTETIPHGLNAPPSKKPRKN